MLKLGSGDDLPAARDGQLALPYLKGQIEPRSQDDVYNLAASSRLNRSCSSARELLESEATTDAAAKGSGK